MIRTPRPAYLLAGGLALGLALANALRVDAAMLLLAVALAGSALRAAGGEVRLALVAALLVAVGWWWGSVRLDALDRSPLLVEVGRSGRATVVVTAPPTIGRFAIHVQGAVRTFAGRAVDEPVQLDLAPGRAPPQGAVLDALAVVELPPGPVRGFDERSWLLRHGVHVVLRVDRWAQVGSRGGLGGLADRLRSGLAGSIAVGLGGERRAVIEGIVLGDGSALSAAERSDFQASGLYHLLAVSGQNVIFVAAGTLILAWLLGVSRWVGEIAALGGIACYVLAVGPQPSVIRAGIAGALGSLAWLVGRLRDAWHALLLAAIALLGWNPYLVHDPGFQLSFAAVVAIFTIVPAIARRLEPVPLPRGVRLGVAVSIGCGITTAPIVWFEFGYLPLLGVPANALAEPAMPVLLALSFLTAGLSVFFPSGAAVVAWLNGWVALYLAGCAHLIGTLPFAQVRSGRGIAVVLAVGTLCGYALLRPALHARRERRLTLDPPVVSGRSG